MPIKWNGRAVRDRVRAAANRGVLRSTEAVRNEAISLIQNSPPSGREYRRRGVTHIASSPGNPPRTDTGNLVRSIQTKYNRAQLLGTVNASAAYAASLEFGTPTIEPRPFMRPALADLRDDIRKWINDEISAELRKR